MIYWVNFFHIYQPPGWDIATIKKVARESYAPFFDILKRNPRIKITLNISASLTEQLVKYKLSKIIDDIKFLASRGQIEFTGSARYHIILPLLPEKIALRQIEQNRDINQKYIGKDYRPTGFFPPEMCWGDNLTSILKKLKIKWLILDEISYNGRLGQVNYENGFRLKEAKIKVLFRNRILSNYFAFEAPVDQPEIFLEKLEREGRSKKILITAMDGENLGHHRPGTEKLWEALVRRRQFQTLTVSQLSEKYEKFEEICPRRASWASEEEDFKNRIPYLLWKNPENPIHVKQWELTGKIINLVDQAHDNGDKNYTEAENRLDKALASDQFWWASMHPWWSKEIVINETRELAGVVEPVKSLQVNERQEIEELTAEIISLANEWQDSGQAKRKSVEFLKKVGFVPHLGGKKLINNKQ